MTPTALSEGRGRIPQQSSVLVQNHFHSSPDSPQRAQSIIGWLRSYARDRIDGASIDRLQSIPPHVILDFGNRRLFGMQVSESFGGLALRTQDALAVLEQAAALDFGVATWLMASIYPGIRPISAFGSEPVQSKFLEQLACGRMLAAYAQTETGAGSDFTAVSASADQLPDGGWRLTGSKVWIGNATWAGLFSVVARASLADGTTGKLVVLAVPASAAGVVFGQAHESLGIRGMVQARVSFDHVVLDSDAVLGSVEDGLRVCLDSMSFSRVAIAATCLGAMKRVAQVAIRFAERRSVSTGVLKANPIVVRSFSELVYKIASVEALVREISEALDRGEGVPVEVFAACKVVAAEFLWQSADWFLQLLGSRGYDEANPAARLLRDSRVARIFEGPTEPLFAFVGAKTAFEGSGFHSFLTNNLRGTHQSDTLLEAARRLPRSQPGEQRSNRRLRHQHLGIAGTWALLAASLAKSAANARFGDWASEHFLKHVSAADNVSSFSPLRGLDEYISAYSASIGDGALPRSGPRVESDSLLWP